jgi:hypothetical protein
VGRFFIPARSPEDWKGLLTEPEKQWKTRYSAKALAYCWQEVNDFPLSVKRVFERSGIPVFEDAKLLLAFPEYKVPLEPYWVTPFSK